MGFTVFPSANDVHQAGSAGDGKKLKETSLIGWIAPFLSSNYVASGFSFPPNALSLSLGIGSGVCFIEGYRCETNSESPSLTNNATNYIYAQVSYQALKVTTCDVVTNTTGVQPAHSVFLGTAITSGGQITSTSITGRTTTSYIAQLAASILPKQTMSFFYSGSLSSSLAGNAISLSRVVGAITASAPTKYFISDSGSFTDKTTEAGDATTGDFQLVNGSTPSVNDATYFGHTQKFSGIQVDVGTNGVGNYTLTWEYWNGSAWTTLTFTVQGAVNFKEGTGNNTNYFAPPSDWATTSVNGQTLYWVRARISAFTSMTTVPLGDQVWLSPLGTGVGVPIPQDCTLLAATIAAITVSGTTSDTKFLFINKAQAAGTVGTFTKAEAASRSDMTDLNFAAGEELIIQMIDNDNHGVSGGTQFGNINIICEFGSLSA